MRKILALAILASLALAACGPAEPEGYVKGEEPAATEQPATTEGSGGGIQIQGGAAGASGIAPVTGTENLQGSGGGGGVAAAAKEQAQRVSGSAGSSLDQMPEGE